MLRRGAAMRSIGRDESESSPVSVNSPSWNARTPVTRRASVPALPQSTTALFRPCRPTPCTVTVSASCTSAPSARTAASVDSVSADRPKPWMRVSPSAIAPTRSARWLIDLSPGTAKCPSSAAAGSIRIDHRRDDHAVPLALEERGRALGLGLAGDEQGQRAAALRRDVMELEVLDVDPLGAERLGDTSEHAGPVGHVDADALQHPGVGVLALEHPAAALRRLADPAGEETGVALFERALDLLDPPPVLLKRRADRVCV